MEVAGPFGALGVMVTVLRQTGSSPGPRATRTLEAILDATKEIFLVRGYSGTTIDGITRLAGLSRASFYTYFPSKRAALLALGRNSLSRAMAVVAALGAVPADRNPDDVARWVSRYMDYLEEDGSLAFAWTQAAHEDDEIREAGQRGHLEMCRRLGIAVASPRESTPADPVELGLLIVSMLERVWVYSRLYGSAVDRTAIVHHVVRVLEAVGDSGDPLAMQRGGAA